MRLADRRRRLHARARPTSSAAPWRPSSASRRRSSSYRRQAGRRHGRAAATTRDFAERCFQQIEGFGSYGFPESHAASFALLVYASAWLKRHHPAAFACALLNSQPMGFYAPAQIVRDAREHGVAVLAGRRERQRLGLQRWSREPASAGGLALRLGLRLVAGLPEAEARAIVAARRARQRRALRLGRGGRLAGRRGAAGAGGPGRGGCLRRHRRQPPPGRAGMRAASPAGRTTCRCSPLPRRRRQPPWRRRRRCCRSPTSPCRRRPRARRWSRTTGRPA